MTHPCVHARTMPDKPAYVMAETGEAISYAALDARSNQGAQLFRALGLRTGDHIALMMENCLAFMEVCWAAQRSGLIFTALSRYLTPDEIGYIVRDCGAKLLIVSPECLDAVTGIAGADGPALYVTGAPMVPGAQSWDSAVTAQPAVPIADESNGRDMLYSSGTTGRPKGVHTTALSEAITEISPLLKALIGQRCGIGPDSVYLSPAPLYHAAPLRFSMAAARLGGTVVIMRRFEAEAFLRCIETYRVTETQVVPTMFVRLLKLPQAARAAHDLSTLRHVVHAAAPCPPDVKRAMIDWLGPILVEYYGGTEGNGLTFVDSHDWLAHPGTVGRPIAGSVRILDESDEELPAGATGMVYFADTPTFSYHNDPEKTRGAFSRQGYSTLGDVGHLDEDGFLYLTDRRAYMIISGGVNIYPQEAENVLIGHPAVADVAVFGVPDAEMGEQVKAVVQPAEGAQPGPALEAELIAYVRARLSPVKCPRSIDFDAALPRTATGKLLKRLLRDRYWPQAAAPA